jgi:gliding motility-associated-like protein
MSLHFNLRKSINFKLMNLFLGLLGLMFTVSLEAQNDLWIAKPDLGDGATGVKRTGAVSFSINGKIYIALGKDGSTYFQDVWEYDTIAETWTQKADFSGAGRTGAFAMVINNHAIVGTGETSTGLSNKVYNYEPVNNTWIPASNFAGGVRSYASAFSIGTKGFVVGGNDGSFQTDLWQYNYNGDSWTGKQGFPGTARMKAVAFTIGSSAYYGTGDIGAGAASKDFWEYNIPGDSWTQLADFPGTARVGAIATSTSSMGYLGLGNGGGFLSDFWAFDGTSWTQQTDFTGNARELAVGTAAGDKVYVGTGFGGTYYKDFYQWDPCATPQINQQPVGLDVCEGTDVSFTVAIDNPGGETYQWLKDGTDVAGGTNNTLNLTAVTTTEEGAYTCKITNTCGTSVSDAAILNVTPLPTAAPMNLQANPDTLCPGNAFDITLTADNNGNNEDTLRWYATACGGVLQGSGYPVNSELVVGAPNPLITTDYYARWENQCGMSDCDTLTVVVKETAVEPTSVIRTKDTICHDYNDELMLIADGGSGDSLKWYLGDICTNPSAPYLGSGDTLDLFALGIIPTATSTYSVRWETYCGGDEFNSTCLGIDIVVNGEISISQQPQNISVCEGTDPVQFNVQIDEGTSLTTIFYQWYFNGLAISGGTLDTLTLTGGVTAVDSGYYYCKVYNACDTLNSDSALLSVNLNPNIVIQPSLYDTICEGDSLTFSFQASGSPVLQYQWYFNGVPGISTDTFLTINPATFANTGDYYCEVINGCGTQNTDTLSLEVDTIPVITQQPQDLMVCLNATAEFIVAANGTLPISYQWYKIDGSGTSTLMTGETGTNLQISPVLEADTAFSYYCIVSNECFEGPSSDTASLSMFAQIAVIDSIQSDTNHICYTYPTYINLTAFGGEGDSIRWYSGSCEGDEVGISSDTIFHIPAPAETTTFFARWENACGVSSCDSITIYVAQDPVAIDSLVFEDNNICYNAYDSLLVTAYGGYGDSIYWYEGFNCTGTPFAVTADTFVYIHNIPINDAPYTAKWVNACGESDCKQGNLYINDLTYISDQTQAIEVCENTMANMFVVANGTDPLDYQWYFNGVQLAGMTLSTLDVGPVTFADTGQYYCEVHSECDTAISDSIPLRMLELPYFTLQPRDTAVCEGSRDTIQIKVAGDYPILIQWYENGTAIGGSSLLDTLLIIDPVINTADYYARLSNGCGFAYSDTVNLRALDTIVITEQPQYQNLCLLDTARFSVTAEVTEFVNYQWYKLGSATAVGNTASIQIPNLDYNDEGQYFCIISDTCGELSSDTVVLNMNIPPQVVTDPFGATVCEGSLFQFEATFNDDADSLTYEWNYNDSWIPDSDSNILVFDPIQRGDEGIYYIRAYNNCGEDESVPVNLFVTYLPDMLESIGSIPDTVCPDCPLFDSLTLYATGDGGGYGDHIEWYENEVNSNNIIGIGDTIKVEIPVATTTYYARWVNGCTGANGGGSGGGGGGGGGGSGGGSSDALSTIVTYQGNPTPPSNVNVDVNNFCITYGDSIVLSGDGGYGDRLKWYIIEEPDETFIGQGETLKVPQPMDTTLYAAKWTNHCGTSDSIVIQVNVVPLPEVVLTDGDTICAGQDYELTDVFINYYDSIIWSSSSPTGVFDTANIQYPIYTDSDINMQDTVVEYLILRAYGKADCEDVSDSIKLTYMPLPYLSYNPELTAICRDSLITITASGALDYLWKPINNTDEESLESNPITISPVVTTDYYLIGTSERGCVDSIPLTLDVYPTPYVDLGDSVFLYSCEPVQLDAGGGDGSEYYIWNNGNRTRSITVYETGNYSVIVGNPGCEVSDTGYISLCNGRLFMPNAFTPNEDGLNEKLLPISSDPSIEFHMMIYDRWGKLLFETYDIHQGWDGNTAEGLPCPTGNYVYRLEYQGQGSESPGKKASQVGTVMLVR